MRTIVFIRNADNVVTYINLIDPSSAIPSAPEGQACLSFMPPQLPNGVMLGQVYAEGDVSGDPPLPRIVSPIAFARLFTQAERIAVRSRQETGDAAAKVIADFYELVQLAGSVDLGHPDVDAGLAYMVSLSLISAERKAAILANESHG